MLPNLVHSLSPGGAVMPQTQVLTNRCGYKLRKGQPAMVDVAASATESTSATDPASTGWAQANVVRPTQAGVDAGYPIVIAADDIADDAAGVFVVSGRCEVAVGDDDDVTTDVEIGGNVAILVTEIDTPVTTGTTAPETGYEFSFVQGWVSKATNGCRALGVALEAGAADSTTAARTVDVTSHLRWCIWWGGMWGGVSDT